MERKLGVMLVASDAGRMSVVQQALHAQGHKVLAKCSVDSDLLPETRSLQPDIVLVDIESPGPETFKSLDRLNREAPRPVLLFAARSDRTMIRRGLASGVSTYIVDGLQPHRLEALIEVSLANFEVQSAMRQNLQSLRERLADERDIERATGIIMKHQGLEASQAAERLQQLASRRQLAAGEFARTLIGAAAVL